MTDQICARLTLAALVGISALDAWAQAVPDAGKSLRQLEQPSIVLPPKPSATPDFQAPARPQLTPAPALRFVLQGVRVSGSTAFKETDSEALLGAYIGQEVGIETLAEGAGVITRHYFEHGYPLATAYLPEQEIVGGVVQFVVLEGRYGHVGIDNRSRVNDATLARYIAPLRGRLVKESVLERKLLLLYDLPGVAPSRAVLSPGEEAGETDLLIELGARPALQTLFSAGNDGSRYTGEWLGSIEVAWASPAGIGDELRLAGLKSDGDLDNARLDYTLPLGADGLSVSTEFSYVHYELGRQFDALDASGEGYAGELKTSYPVLRSRDASLYASISYRHAGFVDRIDAFRTSSHKNSDRIALGINTETFDGVGSGGVSIFALGFGYGSLALETPAVAAADAITARTAGTYQIWTLLAARLQNVTDRIALYVAFRGQKANRNLDSSEKLLLGGMHGVRAYPQGEAPADSGYVLNAETRYSVPLPGRAGELQLIGFIDAGASRADERPITGGHHTRHLSGGGFGVDWSIGNDFSLRLLVARRIGGEDATAGSDDRTRGWLQALKTF